MYTLQAYSLAFIFTIPSLLFILVRAEEWPDTLLTDKKFLSEIYSIDNGDRYGRVKVSDKRQNDAEYEYYEASGMMCTTVEFQPYSIFHGDKKAYFSMESFNEQTQDYMGFLVTPNHIGKQTDLNVLSAMSAFSINHGNEHNQYCVRDFAHYGEDPDQSRYGMTKRFDQSNAQFDWIHLSHEKFGTRIFMGNRQTYGCIPVELGKEFTDEEYTFHATVEHNEFHHSHDGQYQFHYDTVWTERVNSTAINACWADVKQWNRTHRPVYIQLIAIPKSSGSKAPTFGPKPNIDYEADTYTFQWSSNSSVTTTCVDIPFKKEYSFVPFMFASVELVHPPHSDDTLYYDQATTIWVENAGTNGMQVCVSELYWADKNKMTDETIRIHYLVVENTLPEDQPATQTAQSLTVLRGFDPEKVLNAEQTEFTEEFMNDTQAWIEGILGRSYGKDMKKYFFSDYKEGALDTTIYYHLFDQPNPSSLMQKYYGHIRANLREDETCETISGAKVCDTRFYFEATQLDSTYFKKYESKDVSIQVPLKSCGGTCVFGRNKVYDCQPYECNGYGGDQFLIREIVIEAFDAAPKCNEEGLRIMSPCNTQFEVSDYNLYEVAPEDGYSMAYFMERYPESPNNGSGGNGNGGNGSDGNGDGKGGDGEQKENYEGEESSGVSGALLGGIIALFVVLMIGEYFLVRHYMNAKAKRFSFHNVMSNKGSQNNFV